MSSTLTINFSLRQNKAIERSIAIDALQLGRRFLGDDLVYVGLGSLWFQDFQLAHRVLGISTMVSIEGDSSVFKRANFNRPFSSIEVVKGLTSQRIPGLLKREDLKDRPWVVWLDYDRELDDDRVEELRLLMRSLPDGSALLTTFNANEKNYANDPADRLQVLRDLFTPDVVDGADLTDEDMVGSTFVASLSRCLAGFLTANAVQHGREGGFVPALTLMYRDSTNMATVGGFLPKAADRGPCEAMVKSRKWCGFEPRVIETQPLTLREVQALCQLMPGDGRITVSQVKSLGFELDSSQLRFFQKHYLRYPTYAEVR